MRLLPNKTAPDLSGLKSDIGRIAARVARDRNTRADLRQEMTCHLLTLPAGRSRSFYVRALGMHAFNYWGRSIVDAPLGPGGRPILARQTVAVGGLHELDHLCRRHAA